MRLMLKKSIGLVELKQASDHTLLVQRRYSRSMWISRAFFSKDFPSVYKSEKNFIIKVTVLWKMYNIFLLNDFIVTITLILQ